MLQFQTSKQRNAFCHDGGNMQIVYNLHITEQCNYHCEFCFAKWDNKDGMPMIYKDKDSVEKLFKELTQKDVIGGAGGAKVSGVRINFAGGEPLMLGNAFTDIVKRAKGMGFETSLITNGSLFERCPGVIKYLDMAGVSIDSLDEDICKAMRRCSKGGDYMSIDKVAALVSQIRRENPKTKLKLNTVVSRHNCRSNIVERLQAFKPDRLKVLRQLSFNGNGGISDEEFGTFLNINKNAIGADNVVIENTDDIIQSYLMIDPLGRFFQNGNETNHGYVYSEPIHKVGLKQALSQISFDGKKFMSRYKEGGNNANRGMEKTDLDSIKKRNNDMRERFIEKFGVDFANPNNYNTVIDTSEKTPEEILSQILEAMAINGR